MKWRKRDLEILKSLLPKSINRTALEEDAPLIVIDLPTERGMTPISGTEALYLLLREKIEG